MSRRRLLFDGELYFDDEQRLDEQRLDEQRLEEPRRHWRRGGFLYRSLLPARRRLDESAEECDAASNATAGNQGRKRAIQVRCNMNSAHDRSRERIHALRALREIIA